MQTLAQLQAGELKGATKLKLSCGLTTFPAEIFSLADTLEMLDLSGNQLSSLPDDFIRFTKLTIVFFSDNLFTIFPDCLGKMPQLDIIGFKANQIQAISETAIPANTRWLILTNNKIEQLPASIGNCHRMQKLMLAGNQLTGLPASLANCHNLELLRISANRLETLPEWLWELPKLSWLAFAGNKFSMQTAENAALTQVEWHHLDVQQQLGEGASGVISLGQWQQENPQTIAVKVFKGEVTSDGFPADEMFATIASGTHHNLVKVLGKIANHPEERQGLVFELIPSHYKNLGGPPSFESCTRDVFPAGTQFSAGQILTISKGIASAAAHLHARGILHGDLYTHNMLTNDDAHTLFGDFGAASIYNRNAIAMAATIERVEVRAFGCLLDDLLNLLPENDQQPELAAALHFIQVDCMQPAVKARPGFADIFERLSALA